MKKSISEKINMYLVVLETCKRHESEWANIPKLVSAINDLEAKLNEINAVAISHSVKTLGISSYKTQKLGDLYNALEEVHGAYRAMASENDDPGMMIRHSYSVTTLRRMNATALRTHIARVAESLIETGVLLEPFGLSDERIGEILTLIEESNAIISTPRSAIVERKTLTKSLDLKVAEVDRIIKERMDNIIRLHKRSKPDLFADYFNARMIINLGGKRAGENPTLDLSSPPEPDDGF